MSLEDCDILELIDRYTSLMEEYAPLCMDLAEKLERFGRMRKELQILSLEFQRRGESIEDPKELVDFVKQKLEEYENNAKKEDNDKGHTES